jgi:hypothetical protein
MPPYLSSLHSSYSLYSYHVCHQGIKGRRRPNRRRHTSPHKATPQDGAHEGRRRQTGAAQIQHSPLHNDAKAIEQANRDRDPGGRGRSDQGCAGCVRKEQHCADASCEGCVFGCAGCCCEQAKRSCELALLINKKRKKRNQKERVLELTYKLNCNL